MAQFLTANPLALVALVGWTVASIAAGWKAGEKSWLVSGQLAIQIATRDLNELVDGLRAQLERTSADLVDQERRSEERRLVIERVLQERDTWQNLYSDQAIAHGNAQAVMMDAVEFLERKLRQAGITVNLPDIIRHTQANYVDRHVEPLLRSSVATAVPVKEPPDSPPIAACLRVLGGLGRSAVKEPPDSPPTAAPAETPETRS